MKNLRESEKILISKIFCKNIFGCLFRVDKLHHEQGYLMGNDGKSISRNVISLKILVHDVKVIASKFNFVCLALSKFLLLAQDILKSLPLLLLPTTHLQQRRI